MYDISKVQRNDLLYVNQYLNFESGKASDEYLNDNIVKNTTKRVVDVIFCGGEPLLRTKIRKDMLDYFAQYADGNKEILVTSAYVDTLNNYLSGLTDLCKVTAKNAVAYKELENIIMINDISRGLPAKGTPFAKIKRNEIEQKISKLNANLKSSTGKIDNIRKKVDKWGERAGYALTAITATAEMVEEVAQYAASVDTVRTYDNILSELEYCGISDIETQAQAVRKDMDDIFNQYINVIGRESVDIGVKYGWSTAAGHLIGTGGIPGLVVNLTWLASRVVIKDSLSRDLDNTVSVQLSMAMDSITSNHLNKLEYRCNAAGDVNIVVVGTQGCEEIRNLWLADIYARTWCESKYLKHLDTDDESAKNAFRNVEKLITIHSGI